MSVAMSVEDGHSEESEESAALKNIEAAKDLFESHAEQLSMSAPKFDFSSPLLRPATGLLPIEEPSLSKLSRMDEVVDNMSLDLDVTGTKLDLTLPDAYVGWDGLQSPENVELTELEDLFDAY